MNSVKDHESIALTPVLEDLEPSTTELCDHSACSATIALVRVLFPSGHDLVFCGHHAQQDFGREHPVPEVRTQGSEN